MTIDVDELRARFERALVAAGAARTGQLAFEKLMARYAEDHRHYHTLAHIDACLAWLDRFSGVAEHPEEVELALWFMTRAVHDASRRDNERRSAQLARDILTDLGVARGVGSSRPVHRGDGASRRCERRRGARHRSRPRRFSVPVRATSTASKSKSETSTRTCRSDFRLGRRRVLQGFLSRPEIYQVPQIHKELEVRARANLERRVGELVRGL